MSSAEIIVFLIKAIIALILFGAIGVFLAGFALPVVLFFALWGVLETFMSAEIALVVAIIVAIAVASVRGGAK